MLYPQVSSVPPGAEVLAWSEKTGIEMFSVGEHALGIQGHPEFTRDVEEEILEGRLAVGVLKVRLATTVSHAFPAAVLKFCPMSILVNHFSRALSTRGPL